MNKSLSTPKNITGLGLIVLGTRLATHSPLIMFDRRNRAIRRHNGVSLLAALFNFLKLSLLKYDPVNYRHPALFGEFAVLDSPMPPHPPSDIHVKSPFKHNSRTAAFQPGKESRNDKNL
jgi:hypothetical protein